MESKAPSSSKAERFLKCFCGCKDMTEYEVKRINSLTTRGILEDSAANELFHKYLKKNHGNSVDKSEAENNLIIFELCEKMIVEKKYTVTNADLKKFSELKYNLEKKLQEHIEEKTCKFSDIEKCLQIIQDDCCKEIERSGEFKQFKKAISDKVKTDEK